MAEYAIETSLQLDARLSNDEWLERHTLYEELLEEVKRRDLVMFIGANIFSTLWKDYVEV